MNKTEAIKQTESLIRYLKLIVVKENNGVLEEDIPALEYLIKKVKH